MKFKRTRALGNALLPYAIKPVWSCARIRRYFRRSVQNGKRHFDVLLICQNHVAADHIHPIISLLHADPEIKLHITNDHFPGREISNSEIRRMAHVKYVNILHALTKDWDLILYVNHPWGFAAWFAPFLKKIYINHGLYAGKINNAHGEDGVYGRRRTTRPHRGLLYDRMFAASKREQDAAIEANPALAGRVVVTGSLIVDEMKVDSVDRESTRARLGLQPDDCVVHVVSTWGKASLAATMEDTLLAAASNLGAPYRFLFSLHPRFDKLGGTGKARNEILKRWASKGFEIDEANERWRQFVIASDVAIADHSSLALYHHVLGKPVIYVRVEGKALLHGSPFHLLGKRSRYFSGDDDLRAVISEAIAKTDAVSVDIDNLVDHVGNAGVRHLQEMQKLLRS